MYEQHLGLCDLLLLRLLFVSFISCVSTLNYVGNSIFDSFAPFDSLQDPKGVTNAKKLPESTIANLFNCLIIDEAGQCIEIDNYIPLRLGMNRVILIGDPEQLYIASSNHCRFQCKIHFSLLSSLL